MVRKALFDNFENIARDLSDRSYLFNEILSIFSMKYYQFLENKIKIYEKTKQFEENLSRGFAHHQLHIYVSFNSKVSNV
jgi:hypothetical protein